MTQKVLNQVPPLIKKAGSAPGICPCNATYDKFMVSINNSITVSAVLVTKGELSSETVNYDTKTMYQFEPKCNLLRNTLQVKQHVLEAVVRRFLKIS